jgi:Zn finger protein HypA/HybF involved in hydrogenase expression
VRDAVLVFAAALVFAVALVPAAGSMAGSSQPHKAALGARFTLRIGESAQIEAEALQIAFEDVPTDSRCPRGEQCIREGDATVRLRLQKAPGPGERLELRTAPKEQSAMRFLSYEVRLVRLDPYPVSGRPIARGDYVATLELTRGSTAAPDR